MKNRLYVSIALFLLAAVALSACRSSAQAVEKTIYVGPTMVDCTGVGPQKCLLVKENPSDEYQLFYDQIEGFDYEEGYEYEIVVREEKVENPPADASSIRWTLVEMVSKTPAPSTSQAATLEGTGWSLVSYVDSEGETVSVLPDTAISAIPGPWNPSRK